MCFSWKLSPCPCGAGKTWCPASFSPPLLVTCALELRSQDRGSAVGLMKTPPGFRDPGLGGAEPELAPCLPTCLGRRDAMGQEQEIAHHLEGLKAGQITPLALCRGQEYLTSSSKSLLHSNPARSPAPAPQAPCTGGCDEPHPPEQLPERNPKRWENRQKHQAWPNLPLRIPARLADQLGHADGLCFHV